LERGEKKKAKKRVDRRGMGQQRTMAGRRPGGGVILTTVGEGGQRQKSTELITEPRNRIRPVAPGHNKPERKEESPWGRGSGVSRCSLLYFGTTIGMGKRQSRSSKRRKQRGRGERERKEKG